MTAVVGECGVPLPVAPAAGPVRLAAQDTAPFMAALVPFGLAVGSASVAAGLSFVQAMYGALVMLAGAAQLAVVESLGRADGIVAAVVVTLLINLRFVYYGAGAARWFASARLPMRLLLVFPLVDQSFLLGQQRFDDSVDLVWRRRYYLTVTALLASSFVISQVVGYRLGAGLPPALGLHLAAPLVFAGMLAKHLQTPTARAAAVGAALAVPLLGGLTGPATLPAAIALGVLVGSRRWTR
ncbi:AzlC family ABC transporter permease [Nocardioides sp.]|uniref:AzlC family ABC transporter permease n=1 Tax=Nocardioides sp. TaxID=35761 RepID=UPI0035280A9A